MRLHGCLALLTFPLLGVSQAPGQPPPGTSNADRLLAAYECADYDAAYVEFRTIGSVASFRAVFPVAAAEWIESGDPAQRDRRRLIVASVALEVANSGGVAQWREGTLLLEWACLLVRQNVTQTFAERLWHWAALSLLAAAANADRLEAHVGHALKRFPDEPRFVLAHAVVAEQRTWPDPRDGRSLGDRNRDDANLTIARLKEAMKIDAVRAEASLRLGYLTLRLDRPADALEHLRVVPPSTKDAFLIHLAYLFQGRALDRLNRTADAVGAYRSALEAVPGAQTAQIALAAALARNGDRAEAERVAQAAISVDPVYDPWADYGRGDTRYYGRILVYLRQALK